MEDSQHCVFLVDDQAMIGEAVRRMLADQADVAFAFCQDGDAAPDAAVAFKPTVILQDLVMPSIHGLDMVRRFRSASATAQVPVIVLSAREEAVVKAQFFAAGANDYLVKLPDPIELVARIRVHSDAYKRLLERNAAFAASAARDQRGDPLAEQAVYVHAASASGEASRGARRATPCPASSRA
jgi:DNA-binding response OmpR family regulator